MDFLRNIIFIALSLSVFPSIGSYCDATTSTVSTGTVMVPWGAQERMEYAVFDKEGGARIGGAVFEIESIQRNETDLWKLSMEVSMGRAAVSVVEVEQSSFLPLYSYYRSDVLGEIEATYKGGGVSVERRLSHKAKHLQQDESTYDLYQACYLMRLFPIEVGYQRKLFVTNSKQPKEQSPATLQVVEMDNIHTLDGSRVVCYRVDARIDEIHSSFWISADEQRWLYRIVDDSGVTMELIPPSTTVDPFFRSKEYGYQFSLPENWMAFVQEKQHGPGREQVVVMTPGLEVDLTMTRHRKFGSLEMVVKGSLGWLRKNREAFELFPGSQQEFSTGSGSGVGHLFKGRFKEGKEWQSLLNAVVEVGEDNLLIVTAIAPEGVFDALQPEIYNLLKSLQVAEGK